MSPQAESLTVAVVGATGVVGRTMIQILSERKLPGRGAAPARLRPLRREHGERRRADSDGGRGGARSLRGRRYRALLGGDRRLAPARPRSCCAGRDRDRQLERLAHGPQGAADRQPGEPGRRRVARGHHRQPQLLDHAARAGADGPARHGRDRAGRRRHLPVRVGHRRGGAGRAGEPDPGSRRRASPRSASVYPHPIAFNALPEIDVFLDNGYTREEWKVVTESRKILHLPDLRLSCTAVRVPVFVSHSEAVHVETSKPDHPRRGHERPSPPCPASWSWTIPQNHVYPIATQAAGRDEVFVGPRPDRPVRRARPGLLGRERQPPQGRGHQRGRDRRSAAGTRLGCGSLAAGVGRDGILTGAERRAALDADRGRDRGLHAVPRCTRAARNAVPGEGTAETEVVFVGEGPGFHEDRLGRPFVGQAGALLDELLKSVGLAPRRGVHHERRQVPPAREPRSGARGDRRLRAVPDAPAGGPGSGAGRHPGPFLDGPLQPRAPGSGRFTVRSGRPTPRPALRRAMTFAMYHPAAALHQGSLKATLSRGHARRPEGPDGCSGGARPE